jgi:hypothetical protein
MALMVTPPIAIVLFTIYVNAIDRSTEIFGFTGFKLFGLDVGWYGIGGFIAIVSGPVCYFVFRRVYGGPAGPSREAGDDELRAAAADVSGTQLEAGA